MSDKNTTFGQRQQGSIIYCDRIKPTAQTE